jgi:subtilisin family serine protease
MLKHRINLITNISVFILAACVSVLPSFSVSAYSPPSSQNAKVKTYDLEVKIKQGANNSFLFNNPNFISEDELFPDSTDINLKDIYEVKSKINPSDFSTLYNSYVSYVQESQNMQAQSVVVDDPGFTTQWNDTDKQWGLVKADFPDAWSKTTGSSSVIVAILDTGIDGQHEDLSQGQVISGFDFLNNTIIPANTNSDDNGHGTLVAGVIGASTNNFRGIAGTNWNVLLMPLKALDVSGNGSSTIVAKAIVYAADHGANIINMSFGGQGFTDDTTLSSAVTYAYDKGVVLVAAAGNDVAADGGNMDLNPVFPVCDDNGQNMIIGVAATDDNDQKANFSNFGRACVDVSAPGKRILSTIDIDPTSGKSLDNGYAYASGTSLAAPFVSGEAALIKTLYPKATNQEVYYRIIASADPIDSLNQTQCDNSSCAGMLGNGRINVAAALQANLIPQVVNENSVIHLQGSYTYYFVSGGVKHQISPFMMQQKFSNVIPTVVTQYMLSSMPVGPFVAPYDGTIIKVSGEPAVYEMVGGIKRPLSYQIFLQRGLSFNDINIVGDAEFSSWLTGTFMPPQEGTLVRSVKDPTVYWVINGLLHPINRNFWISRGLNIFPVITMPDSEIKNYAQGDPYAI